MTAAEQSGATTGVDAAFYPVAVLIDELRHDDLQLRLNSISHLGTIAIALGPERARDELIPFLQEIIDDEDEVLIALAEQLGKGVAWVGGAAHAHSLTGPLEEMCNVEEPSVREGATEALRALAQHMSPDQASGHLCALIARLAQHDSFTSRISSCSLFAAALPMVSETKREELLRTYFRLCGDDTPMVRRQAANVLGSVAGVLNGEDMLDEVLEIFEKLAKDEQDSVRILAVSNCIALGKLRDDPQWKDQILPVLQACADDKSWRVRFVLADNSGHLCGVFRATAQTTVMPLYVRLLSDQEVEVRTVAAARIAAVASFNPTQEFLASLVKEMENLMMPREASAHVRASLAGSILSLTPIFGSKLTVDYLINIFLHLIRDESSDVRLRLIGTLGELSTVVGIEVLSQSLLPSIKELGRDRQWRVRQAVIERMPSLAKYLGESEFTKELLGLFMPWLVDPVFCVRDSAASSLRAISEVLGLPWCESHALPQVHTLMAHKNYLYRISALLCTSMLAEVATAFFVQKHLVPVVLRMSNDPVPNVRVNAAKTMQSMRKCTALDDSVNSCLRRMLGDKDPDVAFFVQRALAAS